MVRIAIVFMMFFPQSLFEEAGSRWESEETIEQAKARLLKRKEAFQRHLAEEERRERLRQSKADQQKVLRQQYAEKKEKARKQFRREEYKFPVQAYNKFVEKREKKKMALEKARLRYSIIQRELRELYKKDRYRINGNKEFKL